VSYETIVVDTPAEYVARITLNRPEKRNAISTPMRVELLDALRGHDADPAVRVTIVRGAGVCFSAGYDLGGGPMMEGAPFYSAPGDGQWARLVYVADDASISYPVVRVLSPPDWQYHTVLLGLRRAMELMLTGDPISGVEAAAIGFANRSFPPDRLEESVLAIAGRVAGIPSDLTQINKRSVHRAFDVWGARAAIRAGTELQALAGHTETALARREGLLERIKGETRA